MRFTIAGWLLAAASCGVSEEQPNPDCPRRGTGSANCGNGRLETGEPTTPDCCPVSGARYRVDLMDLGLWGHCSNTGL